MSEAFDWHSDAACAAPEITEETFFGSQRQERSMSPKKVKQAAVICKDCPVFKDCLRSALEYEEQYGVWAGTSGRIRKRIQRMLSEKLVTIEEVVEDYANGRTARYDGREDKV